MTRFISNGCRRRREKKVTQVDTNQRLVAPFNLVAHRLGQARIQAQTVQFNMTIMHGHNGVQVLPRPNHLHVLPLPVMNMTKCLMEKEAIDQIGIGKNDQVIPRGNVFHMETSFAAPVMVLRAKCQRDVGIVQQVVYRRRKEVATFLSIPNNVPFLL